jgi:hypothetical protein
MRVTLLCALMVGFLAACQTVKSSHCTAFEAIPPSHAQIDVMTPEEKARALAELLKFERICGVKK